MFKYFGVISVLLTWTALGYMLVRTYSKDHGSLSRHAASSKRAAIFFTAVLLPTGVAFCAWSMAWLGPHIGLTILFSIVLVATLLCLLLTVLITDTPGWRRKAHHHIAYTMAVLFMPLALLITIAPGVSLPARVLCAVMFAYMVTSYTWVVLMHHFTDKFLIFQISYIMVFQMVALVAGYLG